MGHSVEASDSTSGMLPTAYEVRDSDFDTLLLTAEFASVNGKAVLRTTAPQTGVEGAFTAEAGDTSTTWPMIPLSDENSGFSITRAATFLQPRNDPKMLAEASTVLALHAFDRLQHHIDAHGVHSDETQEHMKNFEQALAFAAQSNHREIRSDQFQGTMTVFKGETDTEVDVYAPVPLERFPMLQPAATSSTNVHEMGFVSQGTEEKSLGSVSVTEHNEARLTREQQLALLAETNPTTASEWGAYFASDTMSDEVRKHLNKNPGKIPFAEGLVGNLQHIPHTVTLDYNGSPTKFRVPVDDVQKAFDVVDTRTQMIPEVREGVYRALLATAADRLRRRIGSIGVGNNATGLAEHVHETMRLPNQHDAWLEPDLKFYVGMCKAVKACEQKRLEKVSPVDGPAGEDVSQRVTLLMDAPTQTYRV